jgi:hypothetical protein
LPGSRAHSWTAALLVALFAGVALVAGCGSSGDDTSSISEADLKQAVRDARQEERLKALKDQVKDLEKQGDETAPSTSGTTTSTSTTSSAVSYSPYADSGGGWTAEIPTGGGWSAPTQSQPNGDGSRYTTRVQGPSGMFLIVDTTPSDTPAFGGAPVDSRTTVSAPNFGTATKIVFQGNSNFPECEGGLCVDYLIPSGGGGFAILAGGGGDFGAAEDVAAHVLSTLQG